MSNYRKLTEQEIRQLKAQSCIAENWDDIEVAMNFTPEYVYFTRFSGYNSRLMCAGADAFRPLWARRRLNLSAIRLRSEKQRYEAEEKPPLTQ